MIFLKTIAIIFDVLMSVIMFAFMWQKRKSKSTLVGFTFMISLNILNIILIWRV